MVTFVSQWKLKSINLKKYQRVGKEKGEEMRKGCDLSLIVMIFRWDGLPLSQGRGYGVESYPVRWRGLNRKRHFVFGRVLASPPWERRERGLLVESQLKTGLCSARSHVLILAI